MAGNNHTFLNGGYYVYKSLETNQDYVNPPNYKSYSTPDVAGDVNWRKGVRNGSFVIDRELFEYGFLSAEGVGWVNVTKLTYQP